MILAHALSPSIQRDEIPAVDVLPADVDRWQRMFELGRAQEWQVERRQSIDTFDTEMTGYTLTSADGAVTIQVAIARTCDGYVWTFCDCTRGRGGNPCPHGALAIDDAGYWPVGMLITAPTHVPTERVPLFRTGQPVRILGVKRMHYFVASRRFDGDTWRYGLTSLAGLPCGEQAEDRLQLATSTRRRVG